MWVTLHWMISQHVTTLHSVHVTLSQLNVGVVFPLIGMSVDQAFDQISARLGINQNSFCEPGRALVSECCKLLVRRKANNILYLNDGSTAPWRNGVTLDQSSVWRLCGEAITDHDAFTDVGPTCDSLGAR